jgi:hypothetical protein
MSPFVITILLCAAAMPRSECNKDNAISYVLGPEVTICGNLNSQEIIAKTTFIPRNGEYLKFDCARRKGV